MVYYNMLKIMFKEIYAIEGAEEYLQAGECDCPSLPPDFAPCKKHYNNRLATQMLEVATKHIDIMEKAKRDVLHRAYQCEYQITDLVDPIKVKIANHKNTLYYWICVTPGEPPLGKKGQYTVQDFAEQVEKFIHRRCCTAGMAVMEQKGIQDIDIAGKKYMGCHPHAHILVRRNVDGSPKSFVKNLISSFQRFYKKAPTSKTLYRMPCRPEYIKDKIKYISTGGKEADGKDKCQAIDKVWRQNNDWPEFYFNGQLKPD